MTGNAPALWVKICGLTEEVGVEAAVEAGADAIGFVFASSPRRITPQRAAELARRVPPHVQRVAVTLHPPQSLIDELCDVLCPDVLQTDIEDLAGLIVPGTLRVHPVLRAGCAVPAQIPPRLLFEGPVSGRGETTDWVRAAQLAQRTQLILAGGLSPQNVAAAIAAVGPFGVDVSSGVERAPGVKDPERIRQFVHAARAAAGSLKAG